MTLQKENAPSLSSIARSAGLWICGRVRSWKIYYEQEKERKQQETKNGDDEVFLPPASPFNSPNGANPNDENGRPTKSVKDSKQDKNNSLTGKQPKPSSK